MESGITKTFEQMNRQERRDYWDMNKTDYSSWHQFNNGIFHKMQPYLNHAKRANRRAYILARRVNRRAKN